MRELKNRRVEHHTYGLGDAVLVKYRKNAPDDLFMCRFDGLGGSQRTFYCRKDFDEGEEVWWSNGVPRKSKPKRRRSNDLEDQLRSIFGGGQPTNV